MFNYNQPETINPNETNDIRYQHKGFRIYTNIEDIIINRKFKVEVPSSFLHIRNVKQFPKEDQEYILSLMELDPYDNVNRFVKTMMTINELIEVFEYRYPFKVNDDEDVLIIYMLLKMYNKYLKDIFSEHSNIFNQKKDVIPSEQKNKTIKSLKHLEKIIKLTDEMLEYIHRRVEIIINRNSILRNKYSEIYTDSVDILGSYIQDSI